MTSNEWDPLHETGWGPCLESEFDAPYWTRLWSRIQGEPRNLVYPPEGSVFRALLLTQTADTKVVILGQDPYPGIGQADGLCFSVPCGVVAPRSLRNIYRELKEDIGITPPQHGNLESWARAGVLLLNTTLTVRVGESGSHAGSSWGWEIFTDKVIGCVNEKQERVVFLLWGKRAQGKIKLIDTRRHTVLCSSHPMPLAAHRGFNPFLGSRPFSRANRALEEAGLVPISWALNGCDG